MLAQFTSKVIPHVFNERNISEAASQKGMCIPPTHLRVCLAKCGRVFFRRKNSKYSLHQWPNYSQNNLVDIQVHKHCVLSEQDASRKYYARSGWRRLTLEVKTSQMTSPWQPPKSSKVIICSHTKPKFVSCQYPYLSWIHLLLQRH